MPALRQGAYSTPTQLDKGNQRGSYEPHACWVQKVLESLCELGEPVLKGMFGWHWDLQLCGEMSPCLCCGKHLLHAHLA